MIVKVKKQSHIYERASNEWYVEPLACSEALFRVEKFNGVIFDPACGQGSILKSAKAVGLEVFGADIVQRQMVVDAHVDICDFLASNHYRTQNIVTNPPFNRGKGTEDFIRKSLKIATGKIAIFCDLKYLSGSARAKGLYKDHPPHRVYVLSPRPSCPPGEWLLSGNKAGGGTADWVWLIWDNATPYAVTTFHWLDINNKVNLLKVAA